jgi:hypothetical protein
METKNTESTQATENNTQAKFGIENVKAFFSAHRGTMIKIGVGVVVASVVAGAVYMAVKNPGDVPQENDLEEAYRLAEEAILTEDPNLNNLK